MAKNLPLISICIPLYEHDKHFDTLINSIKSHDAGMPYEICVGESKNAACVNRNLAMKKAKSNFICQLDGDAAIIQDNWLKKMYDTLISNDNIGIVGCLIELPTGKIDHAGTVLITDQDAIHRKVAQLTQNLDDIKKEFYKQHILGIAAVIPFDANKEKIENKEYTVFQCSGVCFLFDRRITGMFSQEFSRAGWEDVDFMARVVLSGYQICVNGGIRIQHPNNIRDEKEQALRNPESPRGFNAQNLHTFMTKWRTV